MQNKKWKKPKLIVLAKIRSEEAVLAKCKNGSSGPGTQICYGCHSHDAS